MTDMWFRGKIAPLCDLQDEICATLLKLMKIVEVIGKNCLYDPQKSFSPSDVCFFGNEELHCWKSTSKTLQASVHPFISSIQSIRPNTPPVVEEKKNDTSSRLLETMAANHIEIRSKLDKLSDDFNKLAKKTHVRFLVTHYLLYKRRTETLALVSTVESHRV